MMYQTASLNGLVNCMTTTTTTTNHHHNNTTSDQSGLSNIVITSPSSSNDFNINNINKKMISTSQDQQKNQQQQASTTLAYSSASNGAMIKCLNGKSSPEINTLIALPINNTPPPTTNCNNITTPTSNKRRKQDKSGKGLRHFSHKVCEKVRHKGTTTYSEVADELVAEFSADPIVSCSTFQTGNDQEPFDQKNIRRRVYDALNVLMAINIITKEKKEIKWIGLPTNTVQELQELERERSERIERIKNKKRQLRDLIIKQIALKNLIKRNRKQDNPDPNSIIKLPFIIVNTHKDTIIDCSISADKSEYLFNFNSTFEIHDDTEILKRMGLAYHLEHLQNGQQFNKMDFEQAKEFLPEALRNELDEMLQENNVQLI